MTCCCSNNFYTSFSIEIVDFSRPVYCFVSISFAKLEKPTSQSDGYRLVAERKDRKRSRSRAQRARHVDLLFSMLSTIIGKSLSHYNTIVYFV